MRIVPTLIAGLLAGTAQADVFLPQGDVGSVLHLNDALEVVGRVDGVENPHGLAVAPGRGLLVIGSLAQTAREEAAEMDKPAGMDADAHDAHHGGASGGTGSVSIVPLARIADHEPMARVEVPGMVHHVEVDAAERYAVVTHPGLEGVSIIDLDDLSVRGPIRTGPEPEYAVYDAEAGVFLVSNAGNGTISRLDAARGIVLSNVPLDGGPKHMDLAPDGTVAAALADEGAVALVSGDGVEASIDVGGTLHGVQIDAEAVTVAATERDMVVRVDRETGERLERSPGTEPYHVALGAPGLLTSSSASAELWRLDPVTLETTARVETDGVVHQIRITKPD
jgi:hypothetical protein